MKAKIMITGALILSSILVACEPTSEAITTDIPSTNTPEVEMMTKATVTSMEPVSSPTAEFIETATIKPTEIVRPKKLLTNDLEDLCNKEGAYGYELSSEERWETLEHNIELLPFCYEKPASRILGGTSKDMLLSSLVEQGAFGGEFIFQFPSPSEKLGVPAKIYLTKTSPLLGVLNVVTTPVIPTPTATVTPIPNVEQGLCPVNMDDYGVRYFNSFRTERTSEGVPHNGIDISGPEGYELKSPHYCMIDYLFIGRNGAHGICLYCPGLKTKYILFGHMDFTYNDFETLKWYGIPNYSFHFREKEGGGKLAIPTKNLEYTEPGEFIHVYMSDTGSNVVIVHVHISTHQDSTYRSPEDPCLYLDCCVE